MKVFHNKSTGRGLHPAWMRQFATQHGAVYACFLGFS